MPYICAHFREKLTPDGEQVYFAVSQDGYAYKELNGGKPILFSKLGTGGVRDIELFRKTDGSFAIIATDLCIVNRMDEKHNVDWKDINHNGSKCLSYWESKDLITFSEQRLLNFGRDDFGCLWAPEVFFDDENNEYLIHWGSTVRENDFNHMSIYCCKTKDFVSFTYPELFFTKENEILDSHLRKIDGVYHLFYKNSNNPGANMHATSSSLFGGYKHDFGFDEVMKYYTNSGSYEGAYTYILPDGRWCLMLDFFGCDKDKMGYVPYVSKKPGDTAFKRADSEFSFDCGLKHGSFLSITDDEYSKLVKYYL